MTDQTNGSAAPEGTTAPATEPTVTPEVVELQKQLENAKRERAMFQKGYQELYEFSSAQPGFEQVKEHIKAERKAEPKVEKAFQPDDIVTVEHLNNFKRELLDTIPEVFSEYDQRRSTVERVRQENEAFHRASSKVVAQNRDELAMLKLNTADLSTLPSVQVDQAAVMQYQDAIKTVCDEFGFDMSKPGDPTKIFKAVQKELQLRGGQMMTARQISAMEKRLAEHQKTMASTEQPGTTGAPPAAGQPKDFMHEAVELMKSAGGNRLDRLGS